MKEVEVLRRLTRLSMVAEMNDGGPFQAVPSRKT